MRPCPIEVAGELFIGGDGLARGYLNSPELTAERFITAEVGGVPRRLYRTGDLAFWLANGNLGFLGREDHQVKIRGFRIEAGEIEARLRSHPAVRDLVVLRGSSRAPTSLSPMWCRLQIGRRQELRAHLLAQLPDHMVPAWWVRIKHVPLSPNGKVDRRALPDPDVETAAWSAPFVAPQGPAEETIARIWQEVLQFTRLGVEYFLRARRHSLKAMQVISRMQGSSASDFAARVPRASHCRRACRADTSWKTRALLRDPARPEAEHYELSHAQQRLWLHQVGGASAYNMPHAVLFDVPLDVDALRRAFDAVIERHEILRTALW